MNHATNTKIFISAVFALQTIGCSEYALNKGNTHNLGDGPQIIVEPPVLDFGVYTEDIDPLRTLTIRNTGASDLQVEDLTLAGGAAASFVLVDSDTAFVLPPGAFREVDVLMRSDRPGPKLRPPL